MRFAWVVLVAACSSMSELPPVDAGVPDAGPVSKADGTVTAWDTLAPLPVPRANHCAVAWGDRLIIAGGNDKPSGSSSFVSLDDVLAASVAEDGTLGPWTVIGHLPSPGTACVLAVNGSSLLLLGGLFADETLDGNIWSADLSGAELGAWQLIGTLPFARRALGPAAVVRDGTLWLTDSRLDGEGDAGAEAVVAFATIGGSWTALKYWNLFRGQPLATFTPQGAVIAGGYDDDAGTLTDVTAVAFDGGIVSMGALPAPRTFGAAAAADDWVFAVGGRVNSLGGAAADSVYASNGDGMWTAQARLPAPRSNHTATVVGDWLFVTGGSNNAPGGDTVYRARVKHPAN
jgi:hypothetical protein